MAKSNGFKALMMQLPVKEWPEPLYQRASALLLTVRGKRLIAAIKAKEPKAKETLVDMVLEEGPSVMDLL